MGPGPSDRPGDRPGPGGSAAGYNREVEACCLIMEGERPLPAAWEVVIRFEAGGV